MTDVYTQSLINQIDNFRNNPSAMQRVILQAIDDASDGTLDIVDPSNPFVFLIESMACVGAALFTRYATTSYRQYPSLAQTQDDLYCWMSDMDYAGRFAIPTTADFQIWLSVEELTARAVATGNNGVKQLSIPRDTTITVAGFDFTMQYPINILVMPQGGFQITYDSTLPSPLQTLTTNVVPYMTQTIEGIQFLIMTVEGVNQMSVSSQTGNISLATGFTKAYPYTDDYYFTRVYQSTTAGGWSEIATSYSSQVFDPTTPTALLTVNGDNTVTVTVPQIYLTNQTISGELRIDIFTTQGPVVLQLGNYTTDQFSATWQDFDNTDNGLYSAPLNNFQSKGINSTSSINGGSGPMTLATLRSNVINNTMGVINLPITNVDIGAYATDLGYSLVTDVDVITNRQFLATRGIAPPTDGSLVTGAGIAMNTLQTTIASIAGLASVVNNGARVTILPSTLYQSVNGVLSIITQAQIDGINALDVDTKVTDINNGSYLYTPFHYVLDTTGTTFAARGYYLDNPEVTLKTYIAENATTDLTVATNTYQIVRTATGYQLQVVVTSSAAFVGLPDNEVFAQLAFIPVGETDYAYLNGTLQPTLLNGQRVWTFDITTNYDVDNLNNIVLTSFSMFNDGPRDHSAPLSCTFQLIYGSINYSVQGQTTSVIDSIVGTQLLGTDPVGVTQEEYVLELGTALTGLWTATRSMATQEVYATHTANVPLLYPENVYLTDPVTQVPVFEMVDGVPQFTILYSAGSPVLDNYGKPVFSNLIGDPILDNTQQPVAILQREISREIDMLLIDGVYWWATNTAALAYKATIAETIVGWLVSDIANMQAKAIENTVVFYYPKSTVGMINVTTQDGVTTAIDSEQTFNVIYYVTKSAFGNSSFTTALEASTKTIIAGQLTGSVVTLDNIQAALRANVSTDDVTSIAVSGLGGSLNLAAVKMQDDSQCLTIGKQLVALADGSLTVQDSINVTFIPFS
jgi:hypothetical protein